jgi:hypothetical protein
MTYAESLAKRLSEQLPHVKVGSLRIWGDWFGRPYDNWHTVVGAEASGDVLFVLFNQGETLSVHEPRGAEFNPQTFCIKEASRVRWQWYSYGSEQTLENLRFRDYMLGPDGWTLGTNDLPTKPPNRPALGPAAELL